MALQVLYGGTFDPVHDGHIAVARHARDVLDADIRLMPARDPPHKGPTQAAAPARLDMLRLAIGDEPGLCVDDRELGRDAPSCTVDTLRALRAEVGDTPAWAILVGADSFRQLNTWKDWRALFALAHIVVAERPGARIDAGLPAAVDREVAGRWVAHPRDLRACPAGAVYALRQPLLPQSSSEIRRRIAVGEPWRDWVAPAVADYIVQHGLYARPL